MLLSRPSLLVVPLLGLLSASALSCEDDANDLEWGVRFASTEDRTRARLVEVSILRGGCDGDLVFRTGVLLVPGGTVAMPPNLGAGFYGFASRARDESCSWFVAGCEEATLPTMAPVIVTLEAAAESPACLAEQCDDGRCEADDSGAPDAATDG